MCIVISDVVNTNLPPSISSLLYSSLPFPLLPSFSSLSPSFLLCLLLSPSLSSPFLLLSLLPPLPSSSSLSFLLSLLPPPLPPPPPSPSPPTTPLFFQISPTVPRSPNGDPCHLHHHAADRSPCPQSSLRLTLRPLQHLYSHTFTLLRRISALLSALLRRRGLVSVREVTSRGGWTQVIT